MSFYIFPNPSDAELVEKVRLDWYHRRSIWTVWHRLVDHVMGGFDRSQYFGMPRVLVNGNWLIDGDDMACMNYFKAFHLGLRSIDIAYYWHQPHLAIVNFAVRCLFMSIDDDIDEVQSNIRKIMYFHPGRRYVVTDDGIREDAGGDRTCDGRTVDTLIDFAIHDGIDYYDWKSTVAPLALRFLELNRKARTIQRAMRRYVELNRKAKSIQRAWRAAVADVNTMICKRRLLSEFAEMTQCLRL